MRLPHLDERLQTVAELFPACTTGADIGADHGKLSCYLLANNICSSMIVSDISPLSLEKAKRLLAIHKLANNAEFRVANGLDAIDRPVQAVAICGMGGYTISNILRSGINKISSSYVILSAHSDIPLLRETITDLGFYISSEKIAKTGTHYYIVMSACQGHVVYSLKELFLGPYLMLGTMMHSREYFMLLRHTESTKHNPNKETRLAWIDDALSRM